MNWLLNKALYVYESKGLYRGNPCDAMAADWLKPVGKVFILLGSECRCCSGVRVATALAVGLYLGRFL